MKELQDYVRAIPDFPKEGIIFRDITTVLNDADGFTLAIDTLKEAIKDVDFDVIAVAESRGFLLGAPLAYEFHKPIALCRKKGKLPAETISEEYELEYGTAIIEMHTDSIKPGEKVILIDDLIATGGTLGASAKLIERLGGKVVKIVCLIELAGLKGREKLKGYDIIAPVVYEGK